MLLTETYLENPYMSQCSYYGKNHNQFDSVSNEDCLKCMINECYVKSWLIYCEIISSLYHFLYDFLEFLFFEKIDFFDPLSLSVLNKFWMI